MKNLLKLILIFFISFDSDASFIESDNDLKDVIKNLKYRNVGPTRGGRVTTVHGVESQKNVFYMGTTGGGVWKTQDAGDPLAKSRLVLLGLKDPQVLQLERRARPPCASPRLPRCRRCHRCR